MKPRSSPLGAVMAGAALLAAATTAALAQEEEEELTWYMVEVIVFERASEIGRNAEAWPDDPGLPALADALELSVEGIPLEALEKGASSEDPIESQEETGETVTEEAAAEDPARTAPAELLPRAFQLVPPEEFRLTDAWKSLEKSSAYRPLLQVAWIQPGFPVAEARLVHVRNANGALGTVAPAPDGGDDGIRVPGDGDGSMLGARIDMARDPSQVALDGTLRVHRARYLHVQADLLYYRPLEGDARAPVPPDDDPNALPAPDSPDTAYIEQLLAEEDRAPRVFRLTESRRMRSRELHYLDHPLFGVLVEAWPLELPDPVQESLETDADTGTVDAPAAPPGPAAGGG